LFRKAGFPRRCQPRSDLLPRRTPWICIDGGCWTWPFLGAAEIDEKGNVNGQGSGGAASARAGS
jgi:acyl CoA:acetate/3-ketoacid CoA transferase beta subunit